MSDDFNIDESLPTASYILAPDCRFYLAEKREYALGDVRVNVRDQVIYFAPPASRAQEEMLCDQAESMDWPLYQDWGKTTKPIWLPIILEGLEGLTFRHELTDYRSGEKFMTLYADEGDKNVGYIYYGIYNDELSIKYIHVNEDKRRGGIATAMAKNLQAQYPDMEIDWGGLTDEGSAFLRALDRNFEPDPKYAEVKQALDNAKVERAALQTVFDAWHAHPDEKTRQAMLVKGERFNELDDLIFDLEDRIRELKPGRWRVVTEAEMSPRQMSNFIKQSFSLRGDWVAKPGVFMDMPFTDWMLYPVDPNGRLWPSSRIFIRDEGLHPGNAFRAVLFGIRVVASRSTENVFGEQYLSDDMFDRDVAFSIKPEPEELEHLKEAVKEGFFKCLNRLLIHMDPLRLENNFALHSIFDRILKAFRLT